MKTNEYLRRIGVSEKDISADAASLKKLQKQHLLHVPFENLDIHRNVPIVLDPERFFNKIVKKGRGGFCYELNGLFYQLLRKIGFQSKIISARVSTGTGSFSPEFSHLAILTGIGSEEFLVDVGFGDFTAEPLKFVPDVGQTDETGVFLIRKFDDEYFEVVKKDGEIWKSEYIFKHLERDLAEFAEMCQFQQTSPDSHFTQKKVCSLMTENGRKTLTDGKFIETKHGEKIESEVKSDREFDEILKREFWITLPRVLPEIK